MLNANGSVSIAVDNNDLSGVKALDGKYYFIVSKNGRVGIKDAANNDVLQPNYTNIAYEPSGGFVLTGNDQLKGFRFLSNYTIEPKYTSIRPVMGGIYVLIITQTGKSGFINNKGDEFFVE